jgi:hypothetical protein
MVGIMSFDESLFDMEDDLLEDSSDQESPLISLHDFMRHIENLGYQPDSGQPEIYCHPDYPDWRIIFEDSKIKLESVIKGDQGRIWLLIDSYSIPEDLNLILSAVESICDPPKPVQRRKAIVSTPVQITAIILGPILAYLGYYLDDRKVFLGDPIIIIVVSGVGLVLFFYGIYKFIEYQRFQRSSLVTTATIVGKGIKKIKTKQTTYDVYFLILRFETQKKDSELKRVNLDVPVSQDSYQTHRMGSTLMLEYATFDHSVAHFESEYE